MDLSRRARMLLYRNVADLIEFNLHRQGVLWQGVNYEIEPALRDEARILQAELNAAAGVLASEP